MKVSLIPFILFFLAGCGIDYSPKATVLGGGQTGGVNYTLTEDKITLMYNGGTVTFDPRANDSDTVSSITEISTPAYGSAVSTDSDISFTPDASFIGVVYFDYKVSSGGKEKIGRVKVQLMHAFTWTGTVSSDFSTAGNWCASVTNPGISGTCAGGAAPTNADHAYIDDSCSANCEVIIPAGVTIDLKGLTIGGSTLTKTTTAVLNIDSEGYVQTGGTFNGGTGNVNVVNFGGFKLLGGTFNAPSGTFPGTGTLKINRGMGKFSSDATFNHNNGTVQVGGGWNGTFSFYPYDTRFYDVRYYSDGDVVYTDLYGTLFVDHNLYLMDTWNYGSIDNRGTIKLKGDLFVEAEGISGNSIIELTGNPAGQTIHGVTNADYGNIPGLRIKTGTYPVTFTGKFTISYGGLEGVSSGTMTTAGSVMRFGLLGSCASIPIKGGPIQFGDVELMEGCNYFNLQNSATKIKSLKFSTFTQTSIDDGTFEVSGDLDMSSAGNYFGNGVVKLTGNPSGQTITGGTALIPGLEIATGTNAVTLSGRVQIFRYFKMTSVGTFNTAGSVLAFSGGCTPYTLIPGTATYGDVSFGGTCRMAFDLQTGTMKVGGDLYVGDAVSGGSGIAFDNGTIEVSGDISIDQDGFYGNGVVKMKSSPAGKSIIANNANSQLNYLTIDAGTNPVTFAGPHDLIVAREYKYISSGGFTHSNTLVLGDGECVGGMNATMGPVTYNNLYLNMTCRDVNFTSSVDVAGNVTVNPFVLGAGEVKMPNPGNAYHFLILGAYTGNGVVFRDYGATLNFTP